VDHGLWHVELTKRGVPGLSGLLPELVAPGSVLDGVEGWLDERDIPDRLPFLVSPTLEYDSVLNGYFLTPTMVGAAENTQLAAAGDLCRFLNFLWSARGKSSWQDATEADHVAYLYWRRADPDGPRVAASTWNRELALVNGFYAWALRRSHVAATPILLRERRGRDGSPVGSSTPAASARDVHDAPVRWLTPEQYRCWRDVGLRGYGADGLPDQGFRGRWASRNALFADVMVRTGLRLTEQASLTAAEVPLPMRQAGYQRFWLAPSVAKNGSARWVYLPESLVGKVADYVAFDRAEIVAAARKRSVYDRVRDPVILSGDRHGREVTARTARGESVRLDRLRPEERRRLMVRTDDGLEPAALWLAESGMPLSPSSWQEIFRIANLRCARLSVAASAHPHALRHTFAVVTLEQLQRGHLTALSSMGTEARGHYQRVFGDPLDWVRRRLGHRSLETTMTYLHVLQELEMQTRMALVPDDWDTIAVDEPATAGAER